MGFDDCGSCGGAVGPTDEFPWHYVDEDCRAVRAPLEVGQVWRDGLGQAFVVVGCDHPFVLVKRADTPARMLHARGAGLVSPSEFRAGTLETAAVTS